MQQFVSCGGCSCLVKVEDAACPFCGAERKLAKPVGRAMTRRMSRAAWLASGAALAVACTEHLPDANNTRSGESLADASVSAPVDASDDADVTQVPYLFTCVANLPNDAGVYDSGVQCLAPQDYCLVTIHEDCRTFCWDTDPAPVVPNCPVVSTSVACLPASETQDAGVGLITYDGLTGCGGCYGCPPSRLFV